jgi:hypothetical protein
MLVIVFHAQAALLSLTTASRCPSQATRWLLLSHIADIHSNRSRMYYLLPSLPSVAVVVEESCLHRLRGPHELDHLLQSSYTPVYSF